MLLKDIAEKLGAKLIGNGDLEITHVANLKTAKETEISFLSDPKYRSVLSESRAGAVILKEEDVVSVDCGTYMNGFCGDSAYTFCVGEVDPEVLKLLKTTKEALYLGIENAIHGKRLGDIGFAVQQHCEANSYGVVREFVGHGIGKDMHEDPQVPNYGKRGYGTQLKKI